MDTNVTARYSHDEVLQMQAQGYEFVEVTRPGDLQRSWAVKAFDARVQQQAEIPRLPCTLDFNPGAWRMPL